MHFFWDYEWAKCCKIISILQCGSAKSQDKVRKNVQKLLELLGDCRQLAKYWETAEVVKITAEQKG